MSAAALWMVTALYVEQGVVCVFRLQGPQAMILAGYVLANVGLIWSLR